MNVPASARRKVCITVAAVNLNVGALFGLTFPSRRLGLMCCFCFFFCVEPSSVQLLNCKAQLKQTVAKATAGTSNQMFQGFSLNVFLNSLYFPAVLKAPSGK